MVCQRCDHGQRYCAGGCRQSAREASCKRAKLKYQRSIKGRFNNAERQQRFRQQQKQKIKRVTDQGSPSTPSNDLLIRTMYAQKNTPKNPQTPTETVCHFCGCLCGPLFRVGFLKKRTTYPYHPKRRLGETRDDH